MELDRKRILQTSLVTSALVAIGIVTSLWADPGMGNQGSGYIMQCSWTAFATATQTGTESNTATETSTGTLTTICYDTGVAGEIDCYNTQ